MQSASTLLLQQQCVTARAAALLLSSRRAAATTTAFSLSKQCFHSNFFHHQSRSIVTITKTTAAASSDGDERKEKQEPQQRNENKTTSPTTTSTKKKKGSIMIPRKAAIAITPKARTILKQIINITKSRGILLKYEISSHHALRMAFKFVLIKDISTEINTNTDEGISLEVLDDGITPKSPTDSYHDNLPKLYISQTAFMKVLGGTLDVDINVDTGDMIPRLVDREGHDMDPNA
jgi:hypothetical protein